MSDETELFFWILDNDPEQISLVKIEKTQTIIHLRAAIKNTNENELRNYDADTLALWKFSMAKEQLSMFLAQTNLGSLLDRDKLRSMGVISQVFPDPPKDGHLHLVIMQPGGECALFT